MRRTAGLVALVAVTTVVGGPAQAAERRTPSERRILQVRTPAEIETKADETVGEPAVWTGRTGRKRTIGTTTSGVLQVQDMSGRVVQTVEGGRFTSVSLLAGFRLGGTGTDLVVAADNAADRLRVLRVESSGRLTDVTADDVPQLFGGTNGAYSLATYGKYAIVGREGATGLGLFRLGERDGKVTYRLTDTLDLPKSVQLPGGASWSPGAPGDEPQVERMVVDEDAGVLYAAQADVALWRIRLDHDRFVGVPRIVERTAAYGIPYGPDHSPAAAVDDTGFRDRIHAAVGAATIYPTGKDDGYLVVSSQADSKLYVYDRRTNQPITGFQVVDL